MPPYSPGPINDHHITPVVAEDDNAGSERAPGVLKAPLLLGGQLQREWRGWVGRGQVDGVAKYKVGGCGMELGWCSAQGWRG